MLAILKEDTTETGTLLDRMEMTKQTQSGTTHVQTMRYGWLPAPAARSAQQDRTRRSPITRRVIDLNSRPYEEQQQQTTRWRDDGTKVLTKQSQFLITISKTSNLHNESTGV